MYTSLQGLDRSHSKSGHRPGDVEIGLTKRTASYCSADVPHRNGLSMRSNAFLSELLKPTGPRTERSCSNPVGEETWPVRPGQAIVVDSSQQMTREPRPGTADVWQLPLLAVSSDSRSELSSYLQELLAPIGRTKARHMNKTQIRALGPAGAIPLLSFVVHEQEADLHLRQTAMRLAAETADDSTIPMLRQLTTDEDSFIASRATKLLDGLTKK